MIKVPKLLIGCCLVLSLLLPKASALDNGIDPYNLGKGDWIYILSTAINKLGGNVPSVTNVTSLMQYEKSQGMSYVIVKAGHGATNFPATSPQFTASLVNAAHNAGLKIFGYTRSFGTDIAGELKIVTNSIALGADGYVIDAEAEWETLTNNATAATNLLRSIKNIYPNKFLGHSPFMYISTHSAFPWKPFGLYCDAVMPQAYWASFEVSPAKVAADLDAEWNKWQNGLTGAWTNAIKPIAVAGQGWDPTATNIVTSADITAFYNAILNSTNPATKGGYKSINWFRGELHTADHWVGIGGNSIGTDPSNPPTIYNVGTSAVSLSVATINWLTDQGGNSILEYGPTTSYGTVISNGYFALAHAISVSGLEAGTTYHFRVKSVNVNGLESVSDDYTFTTSMTVSDIIVDNPSATVTGSWSSGTSAGDKFGPDYRYKSQGTGAAYLTFTPNILDPGNYDIYEWHPAGSNRSSGTPHTVKYNGGTVVIPVNQKVSGGTWNLIGNFNFKTGTTGYVRIADNTPDAGQILMADAIKFVYTPPVVPPAAPSGLTINAASSTQLNLSWTDNSTNETSFQIARSSVNGGPYTDIATVSSNVTTYADTGLSSGTTYYYVVRASNKAGVSADSNQGGGTTEIDVPVAPDNLTASTISASRIDLSWRDNSADEESFIVARSTTVGGPYTDIATLEANTRNFSDTGLDPATTYFYVVRAANLAGTSADTAEAAATTLPLPPFAPSGLTALAVSASEINLTWIDNAANETGFALARATVPEGPYLDIAALPANTTSYSDTGLTDGTTYYYIINASNSGGTSADSAQASATTWPLPPGAPSGVTAVAASLSQIDLSWIDNSDTESSFVLSRATIDGGPYTEIATLAANTTQFSDTNLLANTTYYYIVRAANVSGASPDSAQASATTLPYPPSAPNTLSAIALSISEIKLSWTNTATNETGLIIARSTTEGGPYLDVASLAAGSIEYTNTDLTAGTTYYFVVRAINSGGASTNCEPASATTLPYPPSAPSALAATPVSATQINLSWTDNASNETSVVVARSTTAEGPYTEIATLAANTTSYSNTGLQTNATYFYVVRASNAGGVSADSAPASATTFGPPAAPSALTATPVSSSQINLTWADNSASETAFVIARSTTAGGPYTTIATVGANVTSYSNTGLSLTTTYYYVVRATNSFGTSANSAQASATTLPLPPASPTGLAAAAVSSSQINLSWTDNANNETAFVVSRSESSAGPFSDIASLPANTLTYSDTGLPMNTTYYYLVRATNSGGSSSTSAQASATTYPYLPAVPTALTATAAGTSQINLTWTDNATNENSYVVARSTTSGGPYSTIANLPANTTSYNNTGLTPATTYYYVVRAGNAAGYSAYSAPASATTASLAPAAPSALTAAPISSSAIKLTWTDNSTNEVNFILARSTTSGGPYTTIATLAANTTVYTNTGLTAGTTYYYVVRATNSYGASVSAQASAAPVADIIIDNPAATLVGSWSSSTSATDKYGADYRYCSGGTGARTAQFTPNLPAAGKYQVYEWHPAGSNRSTAAQVIATHSSGSTTNLVNQKLNGGKWNLLGTYTFAAGTNGFIKVSDKGSATSSVVMADAFKFVLSN